MVCCNLICSHTVVIKRCYYGIIAFSNTYHFVVIFLLACFGGIMGDFTWRPLVKQVGLTGGTVPPSTAAPVVGERG